MGRRILLLVLLCLASGFRPPTAAADLSIQDAYFEDYDRVLVREQRLTAGDTLYLRFRIAGFQADKDDQVRLAYWIDCVDSKNVPLTETLSQKIEERLRRVLSPFKTAEGFMIEEIIDPRDTRGLLCDWVETAYRSLPSDLGPKRRGMRP